MKKNIGKTIATIAVLVILAAVVLIGAIVVVPTGYTGVRSTMGQIDARGISSGVTLKIPFVQSVELVNNKQQDITLNDKIWSETSARTAVYFEGVTITYQIVPEKSAWICANVSNYRESLVSSGLVASAIKASSKNLSDVDVTNRGIIEPAAVEYIQKALDEKYGEGVVFINRVVINNADFDESYNLAIAEKQTAQLQAEKQAIENQRNIDKAKADAEVVKTQAEAEAEAARIRAQGEADANAILNASLTQEVLENKKLDRWNGQLPLVYGGTDSSLLLDIGDFTGATPSETGTASQEASSQETPAQQENTPTENSGSAE